MEAVGFFWGSITVLMITLSLILRDSLCVSLLFSSLSALVCVLGEVSFGISVAVFFSVFIFLLAVKVISEKALNKGLYRRRVKYELANGSECGYVCETVYPDIPGKVIIDGEIFTAYSKGTFQRGDVVICREKFGYYEIPLLFTK